MKKNLTYRFFLISIFVCGLLATISGIISYTENNTIYILGIVLMLWCQSGWEINKINEIQNNYKEVKNGEERN